MPRLVALLIRRVRARSGRTLHEVAELLGSSSPNAYGRYEQGRASPTVGKLVELLQAVDCELVLKEKRA
ncbi:MAG: helix-turn-helix transcriptional regulator [Planctomycetota bacterium]